MMQKATSVGMVFTSWQLGPAVKSQHLTGHPVAGIISQTFCSKLKFTYEQHCYLNNQPLTKPLRGLNSTMLFPWINFTLNRFL